MAKDYAIVLTTHMEIDAQLITKVTDYQPSRDRLAGVRDVPLLFLVGTSGAGKNTLMREILQNYSDQYHEFITHTTRAPRMNHGIMEQNHVEYHFIDLETAAEMLDDKDYIEANFFSGNIYGTSLTEMELAKQEHKIVIGDIDVNGVANFVKLGLKVRPVFVLPPSYDVWQQRLLQRYDGNEIDRSDWQRRIVTAKHELEHVLEADYYYLVINDDLGATTQVINAIAHDQPVEQRPKAALAVIRDMIEQVNREILEG